MKLKGAKFPKHLFMYRDGTGRRQITANWKELPKVGVVGVYKLLDVWQANLRMYLQRMSKAGASRKFPRVCPRCKAEPRLQMKSQLAPYCAGCWREYNAKLQRRRRAK